MSKKEELRKAFKAIKERGRGLTCIWAVCKSVDTTNQLCTITIDDLDVGNISLGNSNSGVVLYPTQGENVLVLFEDNSMNGRVIDGDKMDNIELMGNANGGIPITANVVQRLNNIETIVNELIGLYNSHTHVVSGAAATPTVMRETNTLAETIDSDIENDKVKHGNG